MWQIPLICQSLLCRITGKELSQCERERKLASNPLIQDIFVPECNKDGSFAPLQCFNLGSEKQCWCVDPTGQERKGTRTTNGTAPTCGEWNRELEWMNECEWIGPFIRGKIRRLHKTRTSFFVPFIRAVTPFTRKYNKIYNKILFYYFPSYKRPWREWMVSGIVNSEWNIRAIPNKTGSLIMCDKVISHVIF